MTRAIQCGLAAAGAELDVPRIPAVPNVALERSYGV